MDGLAPFRLFGHDWKNQIDRRSVANAVLHITPCVYHDCPCFNLGIVTAAKYRLEGRNLEAAAKHVKVLNLTRSELGEFLGDPVIMETLRGLFPDLPTVVVRDGSLALPAQLAIQISVLQPRTPTDTHATPVTRLNPCVQSDEMLWVITGSSEDINEAQMLRWRYFPQVKRVSIIVLDAQREVPIPDGFWCLCNGVGAGMIHDGDVWCPDGIPPGPPLSLTWSPTNNRTPSGIPRFRHFHWREQVVNRGRHTPYKLFRGIADLVSRYTEVEWRLIGTQHWCGSWVGLSGPKDFERAFRRAVAQEAWRLCNEAWWTTPTPRQQRGQLNLTFVDGDERLEELARSVTL
jgi:hypothetical protein